MKTAILDEVLLLALREDIGDGDVTSEATIDPNSEGDASLFAKQNGIFAGRRIASLIIDHIDSDIEVIWNVKDGDPVAKGEECMKMRGNARSILKIERLMLNVIQRMSGIASMTAAFVEQTEGFAAKVTDTRKTTPGLRNIEKEAVRIGGGTNHRFGLYDMILIKDNHIDFSGGIVAALTSAEEYRSSATKELHIEVETKNIEEVRLALETGIPDRIMFDNFTPEQVAEAVQLVEFEVETEASGGITFDTIRSYAATGVDLISVGALTHSVPSMDFSLKAIIHK